VYVSLSEPASDDLRGFTDRGACTSPLPRETAAAEEEEEEEEEKRLTTEPHSDMNQTHTLVTFHKTYDTHTHTSARMHTHSSQANDTQIRNASMPLGDGTGGAVLVDDTGKARRGEREGGGGGAGSKGETRTKFRLQDEDEGHECEWSEWVCHACGKTPFVWR